VNLCTCYAALYAASPRAVPCFARALQPVSGHMASALSSTWAAVRPSSSPARRAQGRRTLRVSAAVDPTADGLILPQLVLPRGLYCEDTLRAKRRPTRCGSLHATRHPRLRRMGEVGRMRAVPPHNASSCGMRAGGWLDTTWLRSRCSSTRVWLGACRHVVSVPPTRHQATRPDITVAFLYIMHVSTLQSQRLRGSSYLEWRARCCGCDRRDSGVAQYMVDREGTEGESPQRCSARRGREEDLMGSATAPHDRRVWWVSNSWDCTGDESRHATQ
jgi:hypothetical protein